MLQGFSPIHNRQQQTGGQPHDLHHVVTGFSQQGPGEAGVIGVTAYQFGYPAFVLIDLAAMALTFHRRGGLPKRRQRRRTRHVDGP
jgi:ubiquinone biosynthesis protein Coq4